MEIQWKAAAGDFSSLAVLTCEWVVVQSQRVEDRVWRLLDDRLRGAVHSDAQCATVPRSKLLTSDENRAGLAVTEEDAEYPLLHTSLQFNSVVRYTERL